jgi:hypothetical protein
VPGSPQEKHTLKLKAGDKVSIPGEGPRGGGEISNIRRSLKRTERPRYLRNLISVQKPWLDGAEIARFKSLMIACFFAIRRKGPARES